MQLCKHSLTQTHKGGKDTSFWIDGVDVYSPFLLLDFVFFFLRFQTLQRNIRYDINNKCWTAITAANSYSSKLQYSSVCIQTGWFLLVLIVFTVTWLFFLAQSHFELTHPGWTLMRSRHQISATLHSICWFVMCLSTIPVIQFNWYMISKKLIWDTVQLLIITHFSSLLWYNEIQ